MRASPSRKTRGNHKVHDRQWKPLSFNLGRSTSKVSNKCIVALLRVFRLQEEQAINRYGLTCGLDDQNADETVDYFRAKGLYFLLRGTQRRFLELVEKTREGLGSRQLMTRESRHLITRDSNHDTAGDKDQPKARKKCSAESLLRFSDTSALLSLSDTAIGLTVAHEGPVT